MIEIHLVVVLVLDHFLPKIINFDETLQILCLSLIPTSHGSLFHIKMVRLSKGNCIFLCTRQA